MKWPIVTHKYRHMRINHHTRVIDHFIYLIAHNNILLAILANAPHGIALSVLFRSLYSHIFQRNIVVGRRFLPVLNGNLKILYIFRITQFERESLDRYKWILNFHFLKDEISTFLKSRNWKSKPLQNETTHAISLFNTTKLLLSGGIFFR